MALDKAEMTFMKKIMNKYYFISKFIYKNLKKIIIIVLTIKSIFIKYSSTLGRHNYSLFINL